MFEDSDLLQRPGGAGAIHTYRDPDAFRYNALGPRLLAVCFLFLLLASNVVINRFTWADALILAFCAAGLLAAYVTFRGERERSCGEIRLSADGTCELERKRGVIRLHVSEIQSVTYWRDSENKGEHYTIHYRGGKLRVSQRMNGFLDFLTRLKTLNPAVDVSSFPAVLADTWQGLGGPATGEHPPRNRFTRSVLFPLIVVILLVYLASQTLLGK